jgi:hypothetical protein
MDGKCSQAQSSSTEWKGRKMLTRGNDKLDSCISKGGRVGDGLELMRHAHKNGTEMFLMGRLLLFDG